MWSLLPIFTFLLCATTQADDCTAQGYDFSSLKDHTAEVGVSVGTAIVLLLMRLGPRQSKVVSCSVRKDKHGLRQLRQV